MENTNEKGLYQVAEIQLAYKSNVKPSARSKVNGSRDASNILKNLGMNPELSYWNNSK
jgi:DNA repair protein RadC